MVIATCLSAETDLETKKLSSTFSKSMITEGEMAPSVKMGTFALVGLTVANIDMVVHGLCWVFHCLKCPMTGEKMRAVMWGEDQVKKEWGAVMMILAVAVNSVCCS